jgi:hypothetical protein
MNPRGKIKSIAFICLVFLAAPLASAPASSPFPRAHSHNDYNRPRPLLDALENGFCSVEADIFLVDGELLVAHDRDKVNPERTLEGMYLAPLLERVKANGGRVYPGGPEFTLLIDIKSDGEAAYAKLREQLEKHSEMLTEFRSGAVKPGAVTVVISGDRPTAKIAADEVRYCAVDGRPNDLESNPPKELVPLVSQSWGAMFKWRGAGPMPEDERAKLHEFVKKAHEQGRRVRFWATPEREEFWNELLAANVDLINTDQLLRLRTYLEAKNNP